MKRLYAYILKSFIGPFIFTFFVCIFFLLMQFLWRYLDELVGKGLETKILIELMSYASLSLVPMALPLAVLLASIMTFGNMGERFELLAIKSSGVSLMKIMKPLIVFNAIVTFSAFILANEVIPVTNTKFAALLWSVKEQRPEMIIKEGVFSNEIDGYSIKVNRRDQKTDALLDIMIYDHTDNKGNVGVTIADSGYLNFSDDKQFMILTLFNGESYSEVNPGDRNQKKTYPFRREKFGKQEAVINVKNYSLKRFDEDYFKDGYKMLNNRQLNASIDSLDVIYENREKLATFGVSYNQRLNHAVQNNFMSEEKKHKLEPLKLQVQNIDTIFNLLSLTQKRNVLSAAQRNAQQNQRTIMQFENDLYNKQRWINLHKIELHRKYTLSIACLIFFFIGAPLGAIIRKGGFGTPVVVSVLLFIAYYLVSMIGEKVAREGVWTVSTSMWFSTYLFFIVGILLTNLAVSDSMLLSTESYNRLVGKLKLSKIFDFQKKIFSDEDPDPDK
ncbi:MAG: LptF/LptG family permease [Prolixibacteraceae bacterium]|nr:LptF/LptG family permease [Prolixibacteraceae bacterium]